MQKIMRQINGNLREKLAEIKDYRNWNQRIYKFLESLQFINNTKKFSEI